MKKQYSINLDTEIVNETKEKIKKFGGRLSVVVENLLIRFNKEK
jgi:hypothetical protein